MIVYDHRERRTGIPDRLAQLGFETEPRDLRIADYVLADRVAVVRKSDRDLQPWVTLGRLHGALADARDRWPVVVLVLQRMPGMLPPAVRRGALARVARQGIGVLEADEPDDVATWILRLARQEERSPDDGWRSALGRKGADDDRLVEQLVAWLPGVSFVGARRLLAHFGTLRALACASSDEIEQVEGFGPKRAGRIEEIMAHRHSAAHERLAAVP